MGRWLDGRSVLRRIDTAAAQARGALKDAVEAAEMLQGELAATRQQLSHAYAAISEHQIEAANAGETDGDGAGLDGAVAQLLDAHEAYLGERLDQLQAAADTIMKLEASRARRAGQLDKAVEAYETRVGEVEASLESDETYRGLVAALGEAEAVSEHARAKLAVARDDARAKGAPFREDPLFMYLWERGFRTPDYKAGLVARMLDGWVAGLCHYDRSWRNFQRLVELPEWLAGHVGSVEAREALAETALSDYEADALERAGADALSARVEKARAAIDALDREIEAGEAAHGELAVALDAAERGEAGPAAEARRQLAARLPALTVPQLRLLSSQTATPKDDALVDRLVSLRKDEMSMELRLDDTAAAPGLRRDDLARIEQARRRFKSTRLDSPYMRIEAATVDETLARLFSGRLDPGEAVSVLSRAMQRVSQKADPRFGGRNRSRTLGLPDIAVGVGMEILKEIGRSSRRGSSGWGGGSLPRGRRSPFPSSPGRSAPRRRPRGGGFETGGGF